MWLIYLAGLFIMLVATAQPAHAHDGQPLTPQDLWSAWRWTPPLVFSLTLSAGLYLAGQQIFWRQVARGRSAHRWKKALTWRAASFFSSLGVLGLALLSPLDALSSALFSAHMGQHILLILVAAPLLVLGDPLPFFILIFPTPARRAIGRGWNRATALRQAWRMLTHPAVVWILHTLALWVWHTPGLYQAALGSEWMHALEHGSFLAAALLFWWVIASSAPGRLSGAGRLDRGLAVLYLFTTALQSGLLGVLITFAQRPWYDAYSLTTTLWGLSLVEDQQLAGVLMWIPSGVVYMFVAVLVFMAWLRGIEQSLIPSSTSPTPPPLPSQYPAGSAPSLWDRRSRG